VENGVEVNIPNLNGISPLHLASQMGDIETVTYLISKSANVMQRDLENKISLHHAVLSRSIECVEALLATKNILINHRDSNGQSALHVAAKTENKQMIKYLIDNGADPLLLDSLGHRPIDVIPGFLKVHSKDNNMTHQGKKTMKALIKRGGNKHKKLNIDISRTHMNGTRSFDHRSLASNYHKEAPIQLGPSVSSLLPPTEKRHQTEMDLELLYYTPRAKINNNNNNNNSNNNNNNNNNSNTNNSNNNSSSSNSSNSNDDDHHQVDHENRKVDKYGFYVSKNQQNDSDDKTNDHEKSKSTNDEKERKNHEEKRALKWVEIIKNFDTKKHSKKILKYCDEGIPDSVRGQVWQVLAECHEEYSQGDIQYAQLLEGNSTPEVKDQILKDIHRTMPNHILFEEKGQGRQMLSNVLTAYSVYKPEVGYCQGMGFITAMFLMFMPEEVCYF
jgi:hypothetical protein